MKHEISAELKMVSSEELEKSVAKDLLIPDPCEAHVSIPPIIPLGEQEVNENSQKHDRGTGNNNNFPDLFAPCK